MSTIYLTDSVSTLLRIADVEDVKSNFLVTKDLPWGGWSR